MQESLLLHLLLLLLHLLQGAGDASSASLALPGCPDKCGNVAIPYPFGIIDGCYRKGHYVNEAFLISCNYSSITPQPFIGRSRLNVFEVSLEKVVIWNYFSHICYSESGGISSQYSTWINLGGSDWPYTFSDVHNRFIVLGCNVQGVITNNSTFKSGCRTYCASKESLKNGSCDGIGCCQASIPKGLKLYDIPVPTMDNNHTHSRSFAPCGYAFLADMDRFNLSATDLLDPDYVSRQGYAIPIVLDWAVGNETCDEARKKANFACQGNSTCTNSTKGPGYRCNCLPGYEGNPYLPQGCQDIDECKDQIDNPCTDNCTNLVGSYKCSCPVGTNGDGKKHGQGCNKKKKSFPATKIVVGVGLGLVLLLAVGFWLYWVLKQRRLLKLREKFFEQNGGLMLQQISQRQGAAGTNKIFTAKELEKATNNYDDAKIIGKGGYGTVYKGILPDNRAVAIKKSKTVDESQIEQFINEVFILSQINHRNVVKLLGCCLETEAPLLVYEYVTNGTLFQHIHDKARFSLLSWDCRLRIASETAAALAYLHSATSIPIIHRDVKSANILLDDNFMAKVSDFGASRLVPMENAHLTTLVLGTSGYLDPEYLRTSQLTEKSDVYSFGVVLVELLTGKKPISFERCEEERNLSNYFILSLEHNRVSEILEMQIVDEVGVEPLVAVAELAKKCLSLKGNERPTMKEVAAELEGLRRF